MESYPILQDLDFWSEFDETFYGFEHIELARNHTDEAHVGQHYAIWLKKQGCHNWRDYFRSPTGNNDTQRPWLIPEEYHYNGSLNGLTACSVSIMKQEITFLWSSFPDPHPVSGTEPWDSMYIKQNVPSLVPGEHVKNPPHFQMTQR